MSRRTGAAGRWASWLNAKRTLTSFLAVTGVAAGVVMATPSALAEPDPNLPPPPDPVEVVPPPADPLAVPPAPPADPLAPPPPADPLAAPAPPVDPAAAPPPGPPAESGTPAPVDPFAPPNVIPEGTPAGQNPTPFAGTPPFRPPTFNPVNGSMVGVGKPIIINFAVPIADRGLAEQAIHISSNPPVPGKFYWMNDSQVRWRPLNFWPAQHHRQHRRRRHQVELPNRRRS